MCGLQGHQDKSVHQAHFAFLEMWLLSFSNVIATSAFSTFGYVAQGELFASYAAITFCYGIHCGATSGHHGLLLPVCVHVVITSALYHVLIAS
jgi:hypothetical protein